MTMRASIHDPKRGNFQTLETSDGPFGTFELKSTQGGTVNVFFGDPEELRSLAAAINLLAQSLEEEQAK